MKRLNLKAKFRKFFLLATIAMGLLILASCAKKDENKSEGGGGSQSRFHISGNQCIDRTTGQRLGVGGQQPYYGGQHQQPYYPGHQQPYYQGQQQQFGNGQYQIINDTCRDVRTNQAVGADACCQSQLHQYGGNYGNQFGNQHIYQGGFQQQPIYYQQQPQMRYSCNYSLQLCWWVY